MKEVTVGSWKMHSSYIYIYICTYISNLVYIPIYGSCKRSTIIKSCSNLSRFTTEKRALLCSFWRLLKGTLQWHTEESKHFYLLPNHWIRYLAAPAKLCILSIVDSICGGKGKRTEQEISHVLTFDDGVAGVTTEFAGNIGRFPKIWVSQTMHFPVAW